MMKMHSIKYMLNGKSDHGKRGFEIILNFHFQ